MTEPAAILGFYQLAQQQPDRTAIIHSNGVRISAGELAGRVNRISHSLRALGLQRGDRVAGILHNGPEHVEMVLATGQVGMIYVPVNWRLAAEEIEYIIQDSDVRLVIAAAEQARSLSEGALPPLRYAVGEPLPGWRAYADLGASMPSDPPVERRMGGMMMYTSGTTGRPKGLVAPLPEAPPELMATLLGGLPGRYGLASGEGVHLVVAPLYHSAPGGHAMGFLHAGHSLLIHDRFDAEATLRDIERYRVTSTHMVPTHFHRMLQLADDVRRSVDIGSLQSVIHAGAPCSPPMKRQMIEWFGPVIWEYLGSTEGVVSKVDTAEWLKKPGTVGRPLAGLTVKIINDGVEAATGEPGTIYFGVPGQPPAFSYHRDPAKSAAGRHGDLVTAGDYGYLDEDGYLFLLDRRADLIITGGVNVYPAEIEKHLIMHPAVNDVAVIGIPDPEWGQQVMAVVQPVAGIDADEDLVQELQALCAAHLASFKRPRRIEFITDFPRTAAGKVLHRVLRDTYAGTGVNQEK